MKAITLPTSTGAIELREADGSRACEGCGIRGGGLLELGVDRDTGRVWIPLCGNCVSGAVAVHLRRRRAQLASQPPRKSGK